MISSKPFAWSCVNEGNKLNMKPLRITLYSLFVAIPLFMGCNKDTGAINVFSIDDDKALGNQLAAQIAADPAHYPLLDSAQYAKAYAHLYRIVHTILDTGGLVHAHDFDWRIKIIRNDSVLNAFAAPGGKIFVYSGIIKYLGAEDQFAGVMAHEMAHADRRHVTDEMTKAYGIDLLLQVAFGNNPNQLAQIAAQLAELKFSRTVEAEADKFAVMYTYKTSWDARGVGKFFEKLIATGQAGNTPQFLSDHPSPANRVQAINDEWTSLGGKSGNTYDARYQDFKNSLP
jgi:predicted Zn-dependent protease